MQNLVGMDIFRNISIPLPSLPEQHAIATALSDMDALITSLDSLIAKKRDIKQATMQQLLTGKTRLPGFSRELKPGYKRTEVGVIPEDWEVKELAELTTLLTNGFVGKATDFYTNSDDGVMYIQGFNVEENSYNLTGIKRVTSEFHKQHSKSKLIEGDLLTIQTGEIGLTTIVPKELEGSNCHALIISRFNKNFDSRYFSYYFNSFNGRARFKDVETGSTMKHLNVGDLHTWLVPFPPTKSEQTALANILSDIDAEIAALEKKRDKTRALKQGMMQELLTGKTRLI